MSAKPRRPPTPPLADKPSGAHQGSPAWLDSPRLVAGGLFGLALVVRVLFFWEIKDTPLLSGFVPDFDNYLRYAQDVLAGRFLFQTVSPLNLLYTLVTAGFMALFGPRLWVQMVVQLALDALAAVLVWRIGRRVFGSWAGLVAGLLYALHGPLVFAAATPLAESLAIVCLLGATDLLLGGLQRPPSLGRWLGVGLLCGLACLGRPNVAPALALVVGWLAWSGRQQPSVLTRQLLPLALGGLLALAPAMAHNAATLGSPTPFGISGGFNFFVGNNAEATGSWSPVAGINPNAATINEEFLALASQRTGQSLTPRQADRWWYGQALAWLTDHPGQALRLYGRKLALFLNVEEIATNVRFEVWTHYSRVLWLLAVPSGLFVALGTVGLLLPARGRREVVLLQFLTLGLVASVVMFFVTDRLRLVTVAFFLLFCGRLVEALLAWRRQGRAGAMVGAVAAAGLALALACLPMERLGLNFAAYRSMMHVRLAMHQTRLGQLEAADGEYRRALEAYPEDVVARTLWAGVQSRLGQAPAAEASLREALRLQPDHVPALRALALIYQQTGRQAQAAEVVQRLDRLAPPPDGAWSKAMAGSGSSAP